MLTLPGMVIMIRSSGVKSRFRQLKDLKLRLEHVLLVPSAGEVTMHVSVTLSYYTIESLCKEVK